ESVLSVSIRVLFSEQNADYTDFADFIRVNPFFPFDRLRTPPCPSVFYFQNRHAASDARVAPFD
ncbi:MAG: hypothetical protein KJZ86_12095, partial [Caldilineaceae bacterium]|nr:hypothetical protein [Caldilineaceae bacterium]